VSLQRRELCVAHPDGSGDRDLLDPDVLPIEALSHLQNDEFSQFRIESRFREQRKDQSEGGTTCGGRVRQHGESVVLRRMFGKTPSPHQLCELRWDGIGKSSHDLCLVFCRHCDID